MARECFCTFGANTPPGPPFFFPLQAMFLLYLDASGSADVKDTNTKHYVYLGLSMQEQDWADLDAGLDAMKARYRYPGEDFELQRHDQRRGGRPGVVRRDVVLQRRDGQ